ncbi:hypothetical protein [Acidithiobacillus thiooxidans]
MAEFCRREQVSTGSFFRWRVLLAGAPSETNRPPGKYVPGLSVAYGTTG